MNCRRDICCIISCVFGLTCFFKTLRVENAAAPWKQAIAAIRVCQIAALILLLLLWLPRCGIEMRRHRHRHHRRLAKNSERATAQKNCGSQSIASFTLFKPPRNTRERGVPIGGGICYFRERYLQKCPNFPERVLRIPRLSASMLINNWQCQVILAIIAKIYIHTY